MTIKEFSIGISRTINLGNFESARVEATVSCAVDTELGYDEQVARAQIELRHLLEETWKNQIRQKDKT